MTDDQIRAMPTADIKDFIDWRYFALNPEQGWLDAISVETEAYIEGLLASEPADEALLSR